MARTRRRTNTTKPGSTIPGSSILAQPIYDRTVADLGDPFVAGQVKPRPAPQR